MTSQPIDHPDAADVGFTRRDLDLAARTAIIRFLEQRDQFHLDETQARQAVLEWASDDLDDTAAVNQLLDLPAGSFTYSRHEADQAAQDALGLFLELRDQHGYDEDHAQAAALSEVAEGTDQRAEQKQHGDPRERDGASMQEATRDVTTLHHTPEEPGTDRAPTWLAETNDRRTGRRGAGQPGDPATRRAELVVDAADDAACQAAMDAVGCDDDRWVDDPLGQQIYEDTLAERLREAGMTLEDHDRTVRERVARTERRQRIRGRYLDGLYGPDKATTRDMTAPPWVDVLVDRAMTVPSDPTDREIRTQIKHLERVESVVGTTMASRRDAEQRGDLHILGEAWAVYDEGERRSAEQAYRDGLAPATPRTRVLVAQAETKERREAAERIEAGEDPAAVYADYTFPRNDELGPVTDMEAHPEPRTYADTVREKLAELANYTEQVPDHDDTRQRLTWEAWEATQQLPESERAQICRDSARDNLLALAADDSEMDRLLDVGAAGVDDPTAGEHPQPAWLRHKHGHLPEPPHPLEQEQQAEQRESVVMNAADERKREAGRAPADHDVEQLHMRDDLPAGAVLLHEVDEDPETGEELVSPGEPIEVVDHDDAVRAMDRIMAGEDPEQVLRETPHHPLIWGTDDEPVVSPVPATPDRSGQARERASREAAAREQLQAAKDAAETRRSEPRDPDRDRHVDDRPAETTSHEIEHEL